MHSRYAVSSPAEEALCFVSFLKAPDQDDTLYIYNIA